MPGLVSTGIKRKHHALDEGGGGDPACLAGCQTSTCMVGQTNDCHTGHTINCLTGRTNCAASHGSSPPPPPPPPPPSEKCSSYTMQRKYVLNASICKLQATCKLIDPSLRRSVLIRNTLFHIDHELRAEGRHRDSFQLSTFIAASTQSTCTDDADKDRLPSADANGVLNVPRENNSSHYRDSSTTSKGFYSHPENYAPLNRISIYSSSCASSPLFSSPPSLSPPASITNSAIPHTNTVNTVLLSSGSRSVTPTTTTSVMTTTSSELIRLAASNSEILDFGDELFSDIDVTLYDFDIAAPLVSKTATVVSPSPVSSSSSSSSDDWPVSGDFSTFSAGDVNSTVSQGNSCRSDILCDELDQIMHVLVDVGM